MGILPVRLQYKKNAVLFVIKNSFNLINDSVELMNCLYTKIYKKICWIIFCWLSNLLTSTKCLLSTKKIFILVWLMKKNWCTNGYLQI